MLCEQTGSVDFGINWKSSRMVSTHWDPELEANLELVKAAPGLVKDD
jgi:hypothetical protein